MSRYIYDNPVVFHLSGKDARRYLNSRLSCNIKGLAIHQATFGAALNGLGDLEALFAVYAISAEEFYVYSGAGDAQLLRKALLHFAVADRITLVDESNSWHLLHIFNEEVTITNSGVIKIPMLRASKESGYDLLINKEAPLKGELLKDSISAEDFAYYRIFNNLPSFPEDLKQDFFFPAAKLETAISHNKGCYPGQEVVEKVEARGKLPEELVTISFEIQQEFSVKLPLRIVTEKDQKECGEILSFAKYPQDKKFLSFALIKTRYLNREIDLVLVNEDDQILAKVNFFGSASPGDGAS